MCCQEPQKKLGVINPLAVDEPATPVADTVNVGLATIPYDSLDYIPILRPLHQP